MLKKTIIVFFLSILLCTYSHAQTFMHGIGVTFSGMAGRVHNPGESYDAAVAFTNFTWFPRFNLSESDRSSLSIGMPVGAGVGFSSGGSDGVYIGFDLPLAIDYNRGRKSTYENESKMGWYVGAGFGYTFTYWTGGYSSSNKLESYGPLLRTGIRFGAGSKHPDKATTLGFYFRPGLDKDKLKTGGIAVLIEF
jgi:hypothetical protein